MEALLQAEEPLFGALLSSPTAILDADGFFHSILKPTSGEASLDEVAVASHVPAVGGIELGPSFETHACGSRLQAGTDTLTHHLRPAIHGDATEFSEALTKFLVVLASLLMGGTLLGVPGSHACRSRGWFRFNIPVEARRFLQQQASPKTK